MCVRQSIMQKVLVVFVQRLPIYQNKTKAYSYTICLAVLIILNLLNKENRKSYPKSNDLFQKTRKILIKMQLYTLFQSLAVNKQNRL